MRSPIRNFNSSVVDYFLNPYYKLDATQSYRLKGLANGMTYQCNVPACSQYLDENKMRAKLLAQIEWTVKEEHLLNKED